MDSRPRRRRGFLGPLILIAVGLIFLLNNLGLLAWDAWAIIFRLWPVLLIGLGLEILIGRRSTVASLIVVAVVVAIVGVALLVMPPAPTSGSSSASETISQPLQGARRANVNVAFGPSAVRIGALTDSDNLAEGTVGAVGGVQLTRSFQVSGDTANFSLGTRGPTQGPESFFPPHFYGSSPNWDLRLNQDVPLALKLNGVGTADIDLSQLKITSLDVNVGVGATKITFPGEGQIQAKLNVGVGETTITVPQGMAVRAQADSGIGGVSVPASYIKNKNVYTSPNYDGSQNRLDLNVKGGVGKVTIQEASYSRVAMTRAGAPSPPTIFSGRQ